MSVVVARLLRPLPRAFGAALLLAGTAAAQGAAPPAWAPPGWTPAGGAAPVADATPVVVAARPIRSGVVLTRQDLRLAPSRYGGGLADPSEAIGRETRTTLYAGRPVRPEDIGPPTLVERNALVMLRYRRGPLRITTEGRALDRGAAGERIRAMNLASRQTVTGRVTEDGAVEVSP
jgi:flagella basal body P-ring formation protein FlgA